MDIGIVVRVQSMTLQVWWYGIRLSILLAKEDIIWSLNLLTHHWEPVDAQLVIETWAGWGIRVTVLDLVIHEIMLAWSCLVVVQP
jgi:hypothetical protein